MRVFLGWHLRLVLFGIVALSLACQNQNLRAQASDDPSHTFTSDAAAPAQRVPPKLIPDPPRKELRVVPITSIESLSDDGAHDLTNEALRVLQEPESAMKNFPLDRRQQVDWVKVLNTGLIQPRASLTGQGEMLEMNMDIMFTNTQDMPYVRFPHLQHTQWLDCGNCHPRIFVPRRGGNPVTMNEILRGRFCGVCHDKVAFSLFVCERCHSVPHEGSGKWW